MWTLKFLVISVDIKHDFHVELLNFDLNISTQTNMYYNSVFQPFGLQVPVKEFFLSYGPGQKN
jgi:hypothetical protein